MRVKKEQVGYYLGGNASRCFARILLLFFFFIPVFLFSQSSDELPLQKALLELAKKEQLSIVFPSKSLPHSSRVVPLEGGSIHAQLKHLLQDTDLFFEIADGQIRLFRKHKLFGYIEDANSGERLMSASIYQSKSGQFSLSNAYGYYSITSVDDRVDLIISYLGYADKQITLSVDLMDKPYTILLDPDNSIDEVVITDNLVSQADQNYIELDKGSDLLLTKNQAVTALGGEPDIFQTMIRQSGIASGIDGIGGIHVRGGKNDQNLMLMDGVKLYNSSHGFGMFSAVNSGVVDQLRLHKSGSSGAHSGRLSSVLNIRTKDPDLQKAQGQIQFTTLAGQASVEVPLVKNKMGFLLSARHTYIDPYIDYIAKSSDIEFFGEEKTGYKFNDVHFKLYGKINQRNRIYLSAFQSADNYDDVYNADGIEIFEDPFYYDYDINYNWKNRLAAIRWNTLIGSSSFGNIQMSVYQYDYRNSYKDNFFDGALGNTISTSQFNTFNAQTSNYELKADFETLLPMHHLKYGLSASHKDYQIGEILSIFEESMNGNFPDLENSEAIPEQLLGYSNLELTLYLSDKIKMSENWLLEGSIYQTIHRSKDVDFELEPIFATHGYIKSQHRMNETTQMGVSLGTFIQTEHLLTLGDNGYPNDIWVPSTDLIPIQRSYQLEWYIEMIKGRHQMDISAYYKKQFGLLRYADYASLPGLSDLLPEAWEIEVELGEANGYGFEVDYRYHVAEEFSFKGVYSFGVMNYQFDNINGGFSFPFDYSIPHTISLGANFRVYKGWRLSLDWFASSGKPYTLYQSSIPYSPLDIDGNLIVERISSENEFRLPEAHKLSVMFSTQWKLGSTKNNISLGIQNLYNRRNIVYRYLLEDEGLYSQRGFPLLPMFLYRITF
ncbi:MAG: carboxypeptidase-like regulatory domain-containing protein [Saprospiraceae bacterium]|nr:carboxypeptidase-like regulatory domain-containing protein [Saprospiraceae bacterium]